MTTHATSEQYEMFIDGIQYWLPFQHAVRWYAAHIPVAFGDRVASADDSRPMTETDRQSIVEAAEQCKKDSLQRLSKKGVGDE